ncbi:MAG: hypothetical protein KAH00_08140 [Cocleimonas sp.]|nr:hypothetical protein [Cocleimonas sp.]
MKTDAERKDILTHFVNDKYEQIICDKCMMTFLTNVYDFDPEHVLLEKRSLGLEYFCEAIKTHHLKKTPQVDRIGIIDEADTVIPVRPSKEEIFSGEETDYRYIYVIEKLEHLEEKDTAFFNKSVKDMDWRDDNERQHILAVVEEQYGALLAKEISQLYDFYAQHKNVLAWDLHGDNLMKKIDSGEIVVIDPYTRRA